MLLLLTTLLAGIKAQIGEQYSGVPVRPGSVAAREHNAEGAEMGESRHSECTARHSETQRDTARYSEIQLRYNEVQ